MKLRIGILTAPDIRWEKSERNGKSTFILHDVRIGIGFHWDRLQTQEFAGELEILHHPNGTQTAETGFVNLMVYGNKDNERITFRIYNEKNGFILGCIIQTGKLLE